MKVVRRNETKRPTKKEELHLYILMIYNNTNVMSKIIRQRRPETFQNLLPNLK